MSSNLDFMNNFYDVMFVVLGEAEPTDTEDTKSEEEIVGAAVVRPTLKEILAHKSVIANQSDVFAAMFYGSGTKMEVETNDDGLQIVRIQDIDPVTFQFMIDCMYNKEKTDFKITNENLEKVAYAADKYNFEKLHKKCIDFVSSQLDFSNCVRYWALAKKYHLFEIESKAIGVAVPNVDVAFSPAACKYADLEMWISVLSSTKFAYKSFRDVLDNAIYWATNCQGCETLESIRDVLKPLQPLFENHVAAKGQNDRYNNATVIRYNNATVANLHAVYTVFFPEFKVPCFY